MSMTSLGFSNLSRFFALCHGIGERSTVDETFDVGRDVKSEQRFTFIFCTMRLL